MTTIDRVRGKVRAASHFLSLSHKKNQGKARSTPNLYSFKMDKKLSGLQKIVGNSQSAHHVVSHYHSKFSSSSTLRRLSLFKKVIASHAIQNHIKQKLRSTNNIRNAAESPTSPVHVVSKTRELVQVTNTTRLDKENVSNYIKILQKSKVFAQLTRDQLLAIVLRLQVTTFIPGEYLMRQGSYGDSLYLVENGRVQITRHSPDNIDKEQKLKELGSGVLLGEIALLTDGQRTASIYAISKVRCLCMNVSFHEPIRLTPSFGY